MLKRTLILACALFVSSAVGALGEDGKNYSAEDIIKFFSATYELGVARGICVGTAEKCDLSQPQKAPPAFNLMVTFSVNSDRLTDKAKGNLREFGKALRDPRLSIAKFTIDGHTDASGSETYNLRLSIRRAHSVVSFLRTQGVDPSRLIAQGFGEFKPRTKNPWDPENRRVETQIVLR